MAKKRNYSSELQKAEVPQRRQRQSQRPERSKPAPKKKKEKEITNYTQDFINIKDIRNGIIETYDNRYIKIIEVEPINFMLRTGEEQNNIIFAFAGWFKIANIKLQFKSITKKADSERHIELLKKDMVGETVEQAKELSKAYIKLIRDVGSQEALTRRFFFIMEYEPFNNSSKANEYTEIYQTLQSAAQTFKSYLGQCGNNVLVHKNEDIFLGETLYMFFNRRSSIDEPFNSRVQRVIADTMTSKGRILGKDEVPAIPVVNYIAPRGLDLSHIGYMVMDGMYYTFLYIKSNGYPDSVRAGWMSALVNAGEGIDIDIHFKKESKSKAIDKVAQKIRLNKIKMKSTYDTQGDYEELRDSIASGYYIKEALSSGGEDLWYMSIIVTLSSKTLDGLQWKKKTLADMLKARDMEAAELKFRQEQAFKSVIPLLELDKDIFNKSKRNVTTSTAASSYMFTSFEMSDDNGILLGVNEHNSSLVILDIFNSKMYKNANMCIIGTSGAGKTFTEQLMALRMRMRGIQVFILAPLKGHEFRRACVNIGGQYVKISPGSPHCINIMEIRIPDTSSDELIEGEGAIEEDSWLARKMQQLNIFFSLLIPDMTNEEEQLLDEAIIDTYAIKGITNDNDSIFIDGTDKKKKMPVLGDLYNQLNNNEMTKRLAIIVSRFVTGSAQSFNNQTNVDLDNKYIVMDISELKGKLLPVGMFIALDYVWDKTKEDRTKKKAIFIDETWMLIGASSNKYAAEFVLEVFKIIRGYGGAAIAATQDLGDFFALEGGKYGKGIVNNSKTKIILQLEPDEAEFVKETMKLSKNEYRNIIGFERGHGLIASNNNKVPVAIKPSETEKALITTDRAELAAQAEAQVNEAKKREKAARDQEMAAKRNTQ
jgi:hypothetical protein